MKYFPKALRRTFDLFKFQFQEIIHSLEASKIAEKEWTQARNNFMDYRKNLIENQLNFNYNQNVLIVALLNQEPWLDDFIRIHLDSILSFFCSEYMIYFLNFIVSFLELILLHSQAPETFSDPTLPVSTSPSSSPSAVSTSTRPPQPPTITIKKNGVPAWAKEETQSGTGSLSESIRTVEERRISALEYDRRKAAEKKAAAAKTAPPRVYTLLDYQAFKRQSMQEIVNEMNRNVKKWRKWIEEKKNPILILKTNTSKSFIHKKRNGELFEVVHTYNTFQSDFSTERQIDLLFLQYRILLESYELDFRPFQNNSNEIKNYKFIYYGEVD